VLLHELNHAQMYAMFEHYGLWPVWLKEGIAESWAIYALQALQVPDAAEYDDSIRRLAMMSNRLPHAEDLAAGPWSVDNLYPTARLLVDELTRQNALIEMLNVLNQPTSPFAIAHGADNYARAGAGPLEDWLARLQSAPMPEPAWAMFGPVMKIGDAWLCMPAPAGNAGKLRALESGVAKALAFEASFLAGGNRQVDVFLTGSGGTHATRALKLALSDEGVTLMYLRFGDWRRFEYQSWPTPLQTGTLDTPAWQRFSIHADSECRQITVFHGEDYLQFEVPDWALTTREWIGIAAFDAPALLRNIHLHTD
jgi:hypothetical protein